MNTQADTPLKLVIFDFDGTLGDTQQLILSTMALTLQEVGLPIPSKDKRKAMIGLPLRETFTKLMPMTEAQGRQCEDTYRRIFTQRDVEGAVSLFAGVAETLRTLGQRGLKLSIASSRGADSLARYVKTLRLNDISYIVSADDVAHAKPAPDAVLKTMEHFKVLPQQTLVVGDSVVDILMARGAKAHSCGVTYGNGKAEELKRAGAEFLIDGFSDLINVVEKIV